MPNTSMLILDLTKAPIATPIPPVGSVPLDLDLKKYGPVVSITPNYQIPHLHHEFPVPSMKDVVLATSNPHLKALRDFLRDEALYTRKSIEEQNLLIGDIQINVSKMSSMLLAQMEKLMNTNIKLSTVDASTASIEDYQLFGIDYNARMAMYQQQVDDFSKVLSMTIGLMREMSLELNKVATGLVAMNHSYILNNSEVPADVKDGYVQLIASLELLEKKASDYAEQLPLSVA